MDVGKSKASGEIGIVTPPTPEVQINALYAQIDQSVDEMEASVLSTARTQAIAAISAGIGASAAIFSIKKAVDASASLYTSGISGALTGGSLNIGRTIVWDIAKSDIYALQRSEILDPRTCAICISIDGRLADPSDPFIRLGQVHTNCRGTWVAVKKTDPLLPGKIGIPKSIKGKFETVEGVPRTNAFTQIKKATVTKGSRASQAVSEGNLDGNPNL